MRIQLYYIGSVSVCIRKVWFRLLYDGTVRIHALPGSLSSTLTPMQKIGARMTTRGRRLAISLAHTATPPPAVLCSTCAMLRQKFEICMDVSFSFRARAGRLSFAILFFSYIYIASHVFGVYPYCVFSKIRSPQETLHLSEFLTVVWNQERASN